MKDYKKTIKKPIRRLNQAMVDNKGRFKCLAQSSEKTYLAYFSHIDKKYKEIIYNDDKQERTLKVMEQWNELKKAIDKGKKYGWKEYGIVFTG